MVMKKDKLFESQAQIFKALGQPTRLQILDLLKEGERCVCEIFPAIQQEQANVSKHLSILKQAGIVDCRKEGLRIIYWIKNREVLNLLKRVSGILKTRLREQQSLIAQM
jgi:ArsR family transcriptional regulator